MEQAQAATSDKIGQITPMNEHPSRIEPCRLDEIPSSIADLIAEIAAQSAILGSALHPRTAANLADLVRIMNTYYSNLIEGNNTRPLDIQRALEDKFDNNKERRNLQLEAAAHVRVQAKIDEMAAHNQLPEPASKAFICWIHKEFYKNAPKEFLEIKGDHTSFTMVPGKWRKGVEQDVSVGRLVPPSSEYVDEFMTYFEERYSFANVGKSGQILTMAAAHHRLNFIHPFPDGNGRVSRLMSHAMALKSGIGAHGLWSISRGLARGLESRQEYKQMMDSADAPRQGDLDGRGNLSQKALIEFTEWFLRICLDQITFMTGMFSLDKLAGRLDKFVMSSDELKPEAVMLLQEALIRGEFARGEAPRITRLPERSARRILSDVIEMGLLASDSPKGNLYLRFPASTIDRVFPRLYPEI